MKRTFRLGEARPDAPREVHDEIEFHLAMRTREFVEQGLSPEAARQAALASFGNVPAIEAELRAERQHRDRRRMWSDRVAGAWQALQLSARSLRRAPAFTLTTAVTLGLGVGALSAIFTVVHAVLLRPLPYRDPGRLVAVGHSAPGVNMGEVGLSRGSYFTYRRLTRSFETFGMYDTEQTTIRDPKQGAAPEQITASWVTPSVLQTLGVVPARGRVFTEDEGIPGAQRVALLSHGYWRDKLGEDPSVLGKTLVLDGQSVEVVGIMPPTFVFPDAATRIWTVLRQDPAEPTGGGFDPQGIARLREGVSLEVAQADLGAALARLPEFYPTIDQGIDMAAALKTARLTPTVESLHDRVVGNFRGVLWLVAGAAVVVLLVACTNVTNLLLVRGEARQRELTVREALGAGHGRVLMHFITEAAVVGALGGAIGLLLVIGAIAALTRYGADQIPRLSEIAVDGTVLLFVGGVALVGAVASSLLPAWRHRRHRIGDVLRAAGRSGTAGRDQRLLRGALVSAQVALALVLLGASGLLVRSVLKLRAVKTGFDPAGVLVFGSALPGDRYRTSAEQARMHDQILGALEAIPGVQSAGVTSGVPLTGDGTNANPMSREGVAQRDGELAPLVTFIRATASYFTTMRIPVLAGRTFSSTDDRQSPLDIVISRKTAIQYWGDSTGQSALGGRLTYGGRGTYTVIGVVESVTDTSLSAPMTAQVYFPVASRVDQEGEGVYSINSLTYVLRTQGDPRQLMPAVRATIQRLDPTLPLFSLRTMDDIMSASFARLSFLLLVLGAAACVTLILGAIGLYGVVAYVVTMRTRELGVRMALGSTPWVIGRLVAREGVTLTVTGALAGLAILLATSRLLRAFLFGVTPLDPLTLVGSTVVFVLTAVLASWIPARRATRINPIDAIRNE